MTQQDQTRLKALIETWRNHAREDERTSLNLSRRGLPESASNVASRADARRICADELESTLREGDAPLTETTTEEDLTRMDSLPPIEPPQPASADRKVFEAGWNAGFQEAQQPDQYPHRNRCEDAWRDWKGSEHQCASVPCPVCNPDEYEEAAGG